MGGLSIPDAASGPSCTPEDFKEGMRHLVGGVTIICTRHEGKSYGLTATAVCSVSAQPPLLLVCLNGAGASRKAVSRAGAFSVNLIGQRHTDLARRFSRALPDADRFAEGEWRAGAEGVPVLADSLASFECTVAREIESGSHHIFIGAVRKVSVSRDVDPLFYLRGDFMTLPHLPA